MSSVTRVHCDVCGKIVPDGVPYVTVETHRTATGVRADACSEACAVQAAQNLARHMLVTHRGDTAIIGRGAK